MNDSAKDVLIGWALRELRKETAIECHGHGVALPARVLEFQAAARILVHDVEVIAAMVHPDAETAIMEFLNAK